jgi:hypothetical protein
LVDCGEGFGELSEPGQTFRKHAQDLWVGHRPTGSIARVERGAEQNQTCPSHHARIEGKPHQVSLTARCNIELTLKGRKQAAGNLQPQHAFPDPAGPVSVTTR